MVWVVVPPGFRVPTFRAVQGVVHPLSVYTPTFTPAIVPFNGTVSEALSAPRVVTVSRAPAIVRAIIVPDESFLSAIGGSPMYSMLNLKT